MVVLLGGFWYSPDPWQIDYFTVLTHQWELPPISLISIVMADDNEHDCNLTAQAVFYGTKWFCHKENRILIGECDKNGDGDTKDGQYDNIRLE